MLDSVGSVNDITYTAKRMINCFYIIYLPRVCVCARAHVYVYIYIVFSENRSTELGDKDK